MNYPGIMILRSVWFYVMNPYQEPLEWKHVIVTNPWLNIADKNRIGVQFDSNSFFRHCDWNCFVDFHIFFAFCPFRFCNCVRNKIKNETLLAPCLWQKHGFFPCRETEVKFGSGYRSEAPWKCSELFEQPVPSNYFTVLWGYVSLNLLKDLKMQCVWCSKDTARLKANYYTRHHH